MNDVPRPAMYGAYHNIVNLDKTNKNQKNHYDVVGPICESGDWLGKDRELDVDVGDYLAILSSGAYCMSMSSNYNSRCRAAEILIDGDKKLLIRRRETIAETML